MDNRSKYTQTFEIKIDYSDINAAKKELTKFENTLVKSVGRDTYNDMAKAFRDVQINLQKIDKLESLKSVLEKLPASSKNLKAFAQAMKQLREEEKKSKGTVGDVNKQLKAIKNGLIDAGKKAFSKIVDYFKSSISDAVEEIKNMTSYYSGGLFYSTSARQQQLSYGLSDSQNYALSKAMDYMGVGSVDDLWVMNEQQQNKFAERMAKYQAEYEKNVNSGFYDNVAKLQAEFKDLKEDLTYEIIDWIASNKDDIKTFFKVGLELMKTMASATVGILKALSWMLNLDTRAETADIISAHSTGGSLSGASMTRNNVTISNNFNNVNAGDQTTLVNAGKQVNRQILKIFNE